MQTLQEVIQVKLVKIPTLSDPEQDVSSNMEDVQSPAFPDSKLKLS